MENNARYSLIGGFSTAVIAAIFGFVFWMSAGERTVEPREFDIVFSGTVTGLGKGADVLFNGIKVGQVKTLAISPSDPTQVIARIEVDASAPVKTDTKALLEFQGLTGIGFIQLAGGTASNPDLSPPAGYDVATILADKSQFQSILDGVRDTIGTASVALARLDGFLADNEKKVSVTLDNVARFSGALAANSDGLQTFLASLANAGNEIAPLATELKALTSDLRGVVGALDPGEIDRAIKNVSSFTDTIAKNNSNIDQFFVETASVSKNLNQVSAGLQTTLSTLEKASLAIDPDQIKATVSGVQDFVASVTGNTDNINLIVTNAAQLTGKLNAAAGRLDGILAKVDGMVSEGDSGGMMAEFTETAKSIRLLAEQLDKRTAEISVGLNKFSGSGLREYQALASEGQKTLRRLERVIGQIEKNPQRLIFGGDGVRDYRK